MNFVSSYKYIALNLFPYLTLLITVINRYIKYGHHSGQILMNFIMVFRYNYLL